LEHCGAAPRREVTVSIISRMLKQTAVYWPLGTVGEFGSTSFGTPVQVVCRWEETAEEFLDKEGVRQISRAVVYVNRDVALGGLLKQGALTSVETAWTDPSAQAGVWRIRSFASTPNFKAREFLRKAMI
jgi:hypothetical protein